MEARDKAGIDQARSIGGKRWGPIDIEYAVDRLYELAEDGRLHQPLCEGDSNCSCRVRFITAPLPGMSPATWANQPYEGTGDIPGSAMLLEQDDTCGCTTFWVGGCLSNFLGMIKPEFRHLGEVHLHVQSGICRFVYGDHIEKFVEHSAMRIDTLWELFSLANQLKGSKKTFKDGEKQFGGVPVVEDTMQSIEPRIGTVYVWLPPKGKLDVAKILKWAAVFDGDDLPYGTESESEEGMRAAGYVPDWEKEQGAAT